MTKIIGARVSPVLMAIDIAKDSNFFSFACRAVRDGHFQTGKALGAAPQFRDTSV